jgi:hypothetical protein
MSSSTRPGSAQAREFFRSSTASAADWDLVYTSGYERAVALVAGKKKKPDLIQLDAFRRDLATVVMKRKPPHITGSELSRIMTWKLTRGKFRPLQKLVDSNPEKTVVEASSESFRLAQDPAGWKDSLNALAVLKGVGVATASAVLAAIFPGIFPFMADETIESVVTSGQRDYNLKAYSEMRSLLMDKVQQLGADWDVAKTGECLWTYAVLSSFGQEPVLALCKSAKSGPSSSSKKSSNAGKYDGNHEALDDGTKGKRKKSAEDIAAVDEEIPSQPPKRRRK